MARRRATPSAALALILAAALVLLAAASAARLINTAAVAGLSAEAARIEAGNLPARLPPLPPGLAAGGILWRCASQWGRARVTLALAHAQAERGEARAAALSAAETEIRQRLSCAPADGNAWLRLAMVALERGRGPGEVTRYLEQAERLIPHEAWTAPGRITLDRALAARGVAGRANAARALLREVMIHGSDAPMAARLAASWPDELVPAFRCALSGLEPKPRHWHEIEAARLGLALTAQAARCHE